MCKKDSSRSDRATAATPNPAPATPSRIAANSSHASTRPLRGGLALGLVGAFALPIALLAAERDAALGLLLEDELRVAGRARLRDGLVPRDEVALLLRLVRAAVERLAAARPLLGDEATAAGLRALPTERDRLRRLALGVARAREERAEPTALDGHRGATRLAHLVGGLRRDLLPRAVEVLDDLHRGPALGIARAREERADAHPLAHHGLAALLADPLRRDLLACSGYPECRTTMEVVKNLDGTWEKVPPQTTDEVCETCGAPMTVKRGRFGSFLACTRYPECKTTKPISLGVT